MEFFQAILGILLLLIIDIILSADNAILIASTTKDLEGKDRKIAQTIGGLLAVLLRFVFVVIVIFIFDELNFPFLYILGGLALFYIAWTLTGIDSHTENSKGANSILKAIVLIIAGDIMMSFDNAVVIAEVTLGVTEIVWVQVVIIFIALMLSLVILLFFSGKLSKFMNENKWLIYVAAWLLMSVGMEMFLQDSLWPFHFESEILLMIISYSIGGLIVYAKWAMDTRKEKNSLEE